MPLGRTALDTLSRLQWYWGYSLLCVSVNPYMSDDANIVDLSLARHRLKLKQGLDKEYQDQADLDTEPLAYVEAVWGSTVYGYNAYTVDMEAHRRGERPTHLRVPETDYEKELIVRHVKALANDLARQFNRPDLIDPHSDLTDS